MVTPTPTPIEPTPTPIPYGSVIEVTISNIEKISTGVIQTLYSKFSIKLVQWTSLRGSKPDIYIHPGGTGGDAVVLGSEEMYRDYARSPYKSIRITDYLDDMPNYTSLFYSRDILEEMLHRDREASGTYNLGTTGYVPQPSSLWLYNRKWFEKYGYDVPDNIEELVDLLSDHKKNKDPDAELILDINRGTDAQSTPKPILTQGVMAAYGIDMGYARKSDDPTYDEDIYNMIDKVDGEFKLTATDPKIIKALDTLKRIYDEGLAGDSNINYNDLWNDTVPPPDYSEYAAVYLPTGNTHSYYIKKNYDGWEVFETQLSMDDTVYLYKAEPSGAGYKIFPAGFLITEGINQEIIDRLIDFIDWCCTDEGILAYYYGIEGEDYTIVDGTLYTDVEKENRKPAALPMVSSKYAMAVLHKYNTPYEDNESIENKAIDAFADKNVQYMDSIHYSSIVVYDARYGPYHVPTKYELLTDDGNVIAQIVRDFCADYVSGKKTAEDFDSYLQEIEDAGIDKFIQDVIKMIDESYEENNEYVPEIFK
ncbi:MAG: hypothetical protein E7315_00085 [Clostridiales bacterium]|nr:hypothetical protein [Clostridiales bacterium]